MHPPRAAAFHSREEIECRANTKDHGCTIEIAETFRDEILLGRAEADPEEIGFRISHSLSGGPQFVFLGRSEWGSFATRDLDAWITQFQFAAQSPQHIRRSSIEIVAKPERYPGLTQRRETIRAANPLRALAEGSQGPNDWKSVWQVQIAAIEEVAVMGVLSGLDGRMSREEVNDVTQATVDELRDPREQLISLDRVELDAVHPGSMPRGHPMLAKVRVARGRQLN